jgi:8-oxo-dGTP pyrophosphatase MutT (NUDIX family)
VTEPAVPVPAATVVVLRPATPEPEVLFVERPSTMAFAPGLHAFPGGRVDPGDADPRLRDASALPPGWAARRLGDNVDDEAALALHHAAIRELFEEVGILLASSVEPVAPSELDRARADLLAGRPFADAIADLPIRLRPDLLVPIALWTTPAFMPRRFSTWFFVADLPPAADSTIVGDELAAHRWLGPRAALDEMAAGRIEMWVPTTSVLERLLDIGAARAGDVDAAISFGRLAPPIVVVDDPETVRIECTGGGGLPGKPCVVRVLGRSDVVVVDPGDPSEAAVSAIQRVIEGSGATLRGVVLTAPDPDHAAAAEALAIPAACPVLVAPGVGRDLPYETIELADGERLPSDIDLRVRLGSPGSGRLEIVPGISAAATPPGSG